MSSEEINAAAYALKASIIGSTMIFNVARAFKAAGPEFDTPAMLQGVAAMVNKHSRAQNPRILPLTMSTGRLFATAAEVVCCVLKDHDDTVPAWSCQMQT